MMTKIKSAYERYNVSCNVAHVIWCALMDAQTAEIDTHGFEETTTSETIERLLRKISDTHKELQGGKTALFNIYMQFRGDNIRLEKVSFEAKWGWERARDTYQIYHAGEVA